MYLDAWLPRGYTLPDDSNFNSVLYASSNWQIISTSLGHALIVKVDFTDQWESMKLISMQSRFIFAGNEYGVISSPIGKHLTPIKSISSPKSLNEVQSLIAAYKHTRLLVENITLSDSIYIEEALRLLPTFETNADDSDDLVIGRWLCGGLNISLKNTQRIKEATGWLSDSDILFIQQECGFNGSVLDRSNNASIAPEDLDNQSGTAPFFLPGRFELENFFREHIIDIIQNPLPYKTMGIDFPGSVVLHGPPGCGKTHAAESLVSYLGWRQFHINSSSVASPYVHETSKKISDVFARAISNAPSVIIIDEMESFLSDRGIASDNHHVEEIAEFLRRIPEARHNRVLIIGMTNRIDMIDPAILRRGRFDHVIEVGYATRQEITDLLKSLLAKIPIDEDMKLENLANDLVGHPLSDVAFVVREGARLAARNGSMSLSSNYLYQAKETLTKR